MVVERAQLQSTAWPGPAKLGSMLQGTRMRQAEQRVSMTRENRRGQRLRQWISQVFVARHGLWPTLNTLYKVARKRKAFVHVLSVRTRQVEHVFHVGLVVQVQDGGSRLRVTGTLAEVSPTLDARSRVRAGDDLVFRAVPACTSLAET